MFTYGTGYIFFRPEESVPMLLRQDPAAAADINEARAMEETFAPDNFVPFSPGRKSGCHVKFGLPT